MERGCLYEPGTKTCTLTVRRRLQGQEEEALFLALVSFRFVSPGRRIRRVVAFLPVQPSVPRSLFMPPFYRDRHTGRGRFPSCPHHMTFRNLTCILPYYIKRAEPVPFKGPFLLLFLHSQWTSGPACLMEKLTHATALFLSSVLFLLSSFESKSGSIRVVVFLLLQTRSQPHVKKAGKASILHR